MIEQDLLTVLLRAVYVLNNLLRLPVSCMNADANSLAYDQLLTVIDKMRPPRRKLVPVDLVTVNLKQRATIKQRLLVPLRVQTLLCALVLITITKLPDMHSEHAITINIRPGSEMRLRGACACK